MGNYATVFDFLKPAHFPITPSLSSLHLPGALIDIMTIAVSNTNEDNQECTQNVPRLARSDIQVLNQHIDDEDGVYRIKYGNKVGYLTITTDVFDEDTMCRPYLLIPSLPEMPTEEWTRMHITRSAAGSLEVTSTNDPLPEIEDIWHENRIDVHTLQPVKSLRSNVHEVLYNGTLAIAKIAAFEWEIPRREQETWAYWVLDRHHRENPDEPLLAPRVLGHLTEGGRIIGLLMEKIEGTFASPADLSKCQEVLDRLHKVGLTHGDVNRYNFIIEHLDGRAKMVDFEHARSLDPEEARLESESLRAQLSEETGRGGPARIV